MIASLSVQHFRNIESAVLNFTSKSAVFCGGNGQGKTSLLESLFFLSCLRSFRTARINELFRIGHSCFSLSADIRVSDWSSKISVRYSENQRILQRSGVPVTKASDFAGTFKTVAFLPDDPEIITGRSAVRRRFFDMFISLLDSEYFSALQQYSLALKNRNLLLRNRSNRDLIESYHPILAQTGSLIVARRSLYSRMLCDYIRRILEEIRPDLSDFSLRMRYTRDTENDKGFESRLRAAMSRDLAGNYTTVGPHLDDFDFLIDGKLLRVYGSRGMCRIASFALKIAEFQIVHSDLSARGKTIVLVDDATGDLDARAKDAFFQKISTADQLFFTCTEPSSDAWFRSAQLFHIQNGSITLQS